MKTRILKLINDERMNVRLASKKGDYRHCVANSVDICPSVSTDLAFCSTYAYDECTKADYAACQEGADDKCRIDSNAPCIGAGKLDYTY